MNFRQLLNWSAKLANIDRLPAVIGLGISWEAASAGNRKLPSASELAMELQQAMTEVRPPSVSFAVRFDSISDDWLADHPAAEMLSFFEEINNQVIAEMKRVEIRGDVSADSLAICAWFASAGPCYIRTDHPRVPISWKWPIRLGFGGDENSSKLRQVCQQVLTEKLDWAEQLSSTITLSDHEPNCDVLLIPWDRQLPEWLLSCYPGRISADVCILLSPQDAGLTPHAIAGRMRQIRKLIRTSAVAWQSVGKTGELVDADGLTIAKFCKNLVREVSHHQPFDIAFNRAVRESGLPPGVVSSSNRFLVNSAIGNRMLNQRQILEQLLSKKIRLNPKSRFLKSLESGTRGFVRTSQLVKLFPPEALDTGFFRESAMATTMSEMAHETSGAVEQGEPPRFIQAKVQSKELRQETSMQAFERDCEHIVSVRIGGPANGWLSSQTGKPFPVEKLPAELDEYELTISLTVLHAPYPCWSQTTILPRRGPSEIVEFELEKLPDPEFLTLRIAVAFRNRIMQTALLRGSVIQSAGKEIQHPIELQIESITNNRFDRLYERSQFDSAIIVNRTGDDADLATFISDLEIRAGNLEPLREARRRLDNAISEMALEIDDDPKRYADIFTDASQSLMWTLAYFGHAQRLEMTKVFGDVFAAGKRIQIFSVEPRHQLPVEYCYDGDRPAENAKVCEHAQDALRAGSCPSSCPHRQQIKEVICPLKFWACSRVIERYVFDPNQPVQKLKLLEEKYRSGAKPRDGMAPFERVLSGMSDVLKTFDDKLPGRVLKSLAECRAADTVIVQSWPHWKSKLTLQPSTLLVIGHTKLDRKLMEAVQLLEIGENSTLRAPELDEHVKIKDAPQPLVILFACEAANSEIQFMGYVESIMRGGAGILLTTSSTIHAINAVELVENLLPRLGEVCTKEGTFGEALRDARRLTLANSSPMSLCVIAFGDADWRLLSSAKAQNPDDLTTAQTVDPSPDDGGGGSGAVTAENVSKSSTENVAEQAPALAR